MYVCMYVCMYVRMYVFMTTSIGFTVEVYKVYVAVCVPQDLREVQCACVYLVGSGQSCYPRCKYMPSASLQPRPNQPQCRSLSVIRTGVGFGLACETNSHSTCSFNDNIGTIHHRSESRHLFFLLTS